MEVNTIHNSKLYREMYGSGRSVGIVCSLTQATEFSFFFLVSSVIAFYNNNPLNFTASFK
jgi:hypothetical protein